MKGLRRATLWLAAALLVSSVQAQNRALPLSSLRSGIDFAGRDVQALQADAAGNPAQLWLQQGQLLWQTPAGDSQRACSGCHGSVAAMKGVALRYPRLRDGTLINLEDQVRQCRGQQQHAPVPAFESDELLALTMLVTQASQGLPLNTAIDRKLLPHWRAGAAQFQRRQGQLNLACTHCHDQHWGQRLYTDALSQGHPNGYPLYRLEWQEPGSLERRLRSCYSGIRADVPDWGDLGLRQLSLYLMWRGQGLPIEVPAVRK